MNWKWRTKCQDVKIPLPENAGPSRNARAAATDTRQQRWWVWPCRQRWRRGHRERHYFDRRVRHRVFRHFWLLWSLAASTAWWCGSGAVRAFSLLWQLRRHCRIRGPWLSDMPHAHSRGAASVWLNVHWVDRDFFKRNRRNTFVVFNE